MVKLIRRARLNSACAYGSSFLGRVSSICVEDGESQCGFPRFSFVAEKNLTLRIERPILRVALTDIWSLTFDVVRCRLRSLAAMRLG